MTHQPGDQCDDVCVEESEPTKLIPEPSGQYIVVILVL